MVNPRFHPQDDKACGLFPPSPDGRVFNGEDSYVGQFPWAVCLIKGNQLLIQLSSLWKNNHNFSDRFRSMDQRIYRGWKSRAIARFSRYNI